MKESFVLYFFEVCTGSQTMGFAPTYYVDITLTQEQKRKAVYCHVSQNPDNTYEKRSCIMHLLISLEVKKCMLI